MSGGEKRQHYVPRMLLKGFTDDGTKDGHLWLFDHDLASSCERTPNGVMWSPFYYSLDLPNQSPDIIENAFADIESAASPIIASIVKNLTMPKGSDLDVLMLFISLMWTRGPFGRRLATDVLTKFVEVATGISSESPTWQIEPGSAHANLIASVVGEVPQHLLQRCWAIILADSGAPDFITSDVPVSVSATKDTLGVHPSAIGKQNTDVTMALNNRVAVLGRYESLPATMSADRECVLKMNARSINAAERFVCARAQSIQYTDQSDKELTESDWYQSEQNVQRVTIT